MSNSNVNNEISSNVPCNPGPSSPVDSSINDSITNSENNGPNTASTKTSINKIITIERTCEHQSNILVNEANIVHVNKETNPSTNQNRATSSSNPFSSGTSDAITSEIIESIINFSAANVEDENNKNTIIPQAKYLFKSQTNIENEGNFTKQTANVNQNTRNHTELPFQPKQTGHINTDSEHAEEQARQVNRIFPLQLEENQSSIENTANLTPHQNDRNVIIARALINENCNNTPEHLTYTVNNSTVSSLQTIESHETVSELQVTTSIYLTNNPSGLPYQPSLTEHQNNQNAERRHRQERVRHTVASIPPQIYSPRRDFSASTGNAANLTPHQNVVPAQTAERCDRDLSDQAESNIEVNITPPPVPPRVIQGPPPISGAPPTYSAVMRLGAENPCHQWTQSIRIQPSPPFIAPIPPPPYAEIQGIHTDRPMLVASVFPTFSAEQMIWGPDPMSVVCPRCTNVVVTSTQSQRSNLTHFSALALCLCGCWPCCLLPYCMDSCKNTYHHCPTCQQFLGMYRPW